MPHGSEPRSLTRGLCLPTNGRSVSISTVPAGPSGLNGSPGKRRKGELTGAGAASVTGLANFLSVSISAHNCVVAGSMYPPKISGLIGSPILDASIETLRLPEGSAKAVIPCCNRAAPAIEAAKNSRRFIGISYLLRSWSARSFTGRRIWTRTISTRKIPQRQRGPIIASQPLQASPKLSLRSLKAGCWRFKRVARSLRTYLSALCGGRVPQGPRWQVWETTFCCSGLRSMVVNEE